MRITLVATTHVWVTPRLVKEADTLTAAGHEVTVVTIWADSWSAERDQALLKTKPWKVVRVDLLKDHAAGRAAWFGSALNQKTSILLSRILSNNVGLAEEAYCRGFSSLLGQAIRAKADLYIAYSQMALPAAARAAAHHKVRFGFDCADLNAEALADGLKDPHTRKNIKTIEAHYLPKAAYVTAASKPMADALAKEYGITAPGVILNVFSKRELSGIKPPHERPARSSVSLIWMSATVGLGRGLEDAVRAVSALKEAELHIYGRFVDADFERRLKALIPEAAKNRFFFHPMPIPSEVLKTVSQHDMGLAMDDLSCPNLSVTICNKFFLYLQAGLAVAASRIPGQESIFSQHSGFGFMVNASDPAALERAISEMAADRNKLDQARSAAWALGQSRFNWEKESEQVLANVEKALRRL